MAATPQREWYEKDYYAVLGVSQSATDKEITKAYRRLAKEHHPDANPGSEDRFKEISAAYDVLGDAEKRTAYDEVRRLGADGLGGFGGAGRGAPSGFSGGGFNFEEGDLGDILGGLFNRGQRAGSQPGGVGGRRRRGQDVEASVRISFLDAAHGAVVSVSVMGDDACATCHGTGAAPGTSPTICSRCSGRGVLSENQGLFGFSRPCDRCGGSGMMVESPCSSCRGQGVVRRTRNVSVRVPAGVNDGQRIRVKGRGGPSVGTGPAGDLFVDVHVDPHPFFFREGKNVVVTVPISLAEAALGAEVRVPTLTDSVTVKVPPGTNSGKKLRVRGRGLDLPGGPSDLLVKIQVAVPSQLSEAERVALESLRAAESTSLRAHLGV